MKKLSYDEYMRLKESSQQPMQVDPIEKGGPGSGNFDHEGRPGKIGGSSGYGYSTTSAGTDRRLVMEDLNNPDHNMFFPEEMDDFDEGTDAWEALNAGYVIKLNANGMLIDVMDPKTGEHYDNFGEEVNIEKGGPGSGNFDHEGRPGMVGGSGDDHSPGYPQSSRDMDINREIAQVGSHEVGSFLGWMGGQAASDKVASLVAKIAPNKTALVRSVLTKVPYLAHFLRFAGPLGIAGSIVGGTAASIGVKMLLDYLDKQGVKDVDDIDKLDPNTMPPELREALLREGMSMDDCADPSYEAMAVEKGGPGSGNFGHAGRPGVIGGSMTSDVLNVGSHASKAILELGKASVYAPALTIKLARKFPNMARSVGILGAIYGAGLGYEFAKQYIEHSFWQNVLREADAPGREDQMQALSQEVGSELEAMGEEAQKVIQLLASLARRNQSAMKGGEQLDTYGNGMPRLPGEDLAAIDLSEEQAELMTPLAIKLSLLITVPAASELTEEAEMPEEPRSEGASDEERNSVQESFGEEQSDMNEQEILDYVMQLQVNLEPEQIQDIIEMDLSKKQIDKLLGVHGTAGLGKSLTKLKKSMGYEEQPILKGGPGSGFYGHPGQRGQMGGSAHSKGTPPPARMQMRQQRPMRKNVGQPQGMDYEQYRMMKSGMPVQKDYDEDGNYYNDDGYYEEPSYNQSSYYQDEPTQEYQSDSSSEWWQDDGGEWHQGEQPNTVMIDQMDDNSQYAEAPNASDISAPRKKTRDYGFPEDSDTPADIKRTQQAQLRSQFEEEGTFQGFNPGDYRYDASSGKWVLERSKPGEQEWNEPKRRWEEKTPQTWQPYDPLRDPKYGVKDPAHPFGYAAGVANPEARQGEMFDTLEQAQTFEELRQKQERAKAISSLEPTTAERLESGEIGSVAGETIGQAGKKIADYARSWIPSPDIATLPPKLNIFPEPKAKPYNPSDPNEPQAPDNMPPYVIDEKGGMSIARADGSVDYFSDARSGIRFWRGEQKSDDIKPVRVKEPTGKSPHSILPYTTGEPRGGYISTENMPTPGSGIMEPYTSMSERDPAGLDPDIAKLVGEARKIEQRARSMGSSQIDAKLAANDYFKAKRAEQLAPVTRGPEYSGSQKGGKIVPGEVPTLTGAYRGDGQPTNSMTPEERAQQDRNIDRSLNYDEYRDRNKRKIAAEEAAAEKLEMDMERSRVEHSQTMDRLARTERGGGRVQTPAAKPATQQRQSPKSEEDHQEGESGSRAARSVGRSAPSGGDGGSPSATGSTRSMQRPSSGPSADDKSKRNVRQYAAAKGMQVSEQNGQVVVQTPTGKNLRFVNYAAAEAYLEGTTSSKKVQKAAPEMAQAADQGMMEPQAEPVDEMEVFHQQAEQMGAKVMMQKNGNMIVFAPEWNPPLDGKQFSSAPEAQAWLTEEYASRGNEQTIQKGFTPLDQADTPADTLPPIKKKSGATPQLTANLDMQESFNYEQWRSSKHGSIR